MYYSWLSSCLKKENKSSPCYSIMTRGKSPSNHHLRPIFNLGCLFFSCVHLLKMDSLRQILLSWHEHTHTHFEPPSCTFWPCSHLTWATHCTIRHNWWASSRCSAAFPWIRPKQPCGGRSINTLCAVTLPSYLVLLCVGYCTKLFKNVWIMDTSPFYEIGIVTPVLYVTKRRLAAVKQYI